MKKALPYLYSFLVGFFVYPLIEIIYRGYTHYAMALAGGLSLFLLFYTYVILKRRNILIFALMSAFIITLIEFIFGVIFNIFLGAQVWDYSSIPNSIMGQISLVYTLLWFLLSFPAFFFCRFIHKYANKYS